jgi:hypothetical protein
LKLFVFMLNGDSYNEENIHFMKMTNFYRPWKNDVNFNILLTNKYHLFKCAYKKGWCILSSSDRQDLIQEHLL